MTLRIVVSASTPRNTPRRTSDIRRHSDGLKEAGEKYSATASQASLVWVFAHRDDVIVSPGTQRPIRLPVYPTLNPGQGSGKGRPSPEGVHAVRGVADTANTVEGDRCLRIPFSLSSERRWQYSMNIRGSAMHQIDRRSDGRA